MVGEFSGTSSARPAHPPARTPRPEAEPCRKFGTSPSPQGTAGARTRARPLLSKRFWRLYGSRTGNGGGANPLTLHGGGGTVAPRARRALPHSRLTGAGGNGRPARARPVNKPSS